MAPTSRCAKTVGSVATHFLPPGTPGHAQAGPTPDFLASPGGNAALAASYLKKAGFASGKYSGPQIEMIGPIDGLGRQMSIIAKTDLEQLDGSGRTALQFLPDLERPNADLVPLARLLIARGASKAPTAGAPPAAIAAKHHNAELAKVLQ